jgi:hypothetical protein
MNETNLEQSERETMSTSKKHGLFNMIFNMISILNGKSEGLKTVYDIRN